VCCFGWVWNFIFYIKRRTSVEGLEEGAFRIICRLEREREEDAGGGENCVPRIFIICTLHPVKFGKTKWEGHIARIDRTKINVEI
jgi:hypothetical protein